MRVPIPANDPRTEERIRAHYEVERDLAERLREAAKHERRSLYTTLYDDLYRLVPDHPSFRIAASPAARRADVAAQLELIADHLGPDRTFLEIGPGDCLLSFAAAERTKFVYAVDVSDGIVDRAAPPPNFALKITDGTTIDVPSDTVDFAFSDQLMEHLHVDDALDQLREVQRVLKPGGSYLVCTPSRLTGPHDISRFYDDVARGFHLHEYTNGELAHLMRRLRFRRVDVGIPVGGRMRTFPSLPFVLFERLCEALPEKIRRLLLRSRIVRGLLGVRIVATK